METKENKKRKELKEAIKNLEERINDALPEGFSCSGGLDPEESFALHITSKNTDRFINVLSQGFAFRVQRNRKRVEFAFWDKQNEVDGSEADYTYKTFPIEQIFENNNELLVAALKWITNGDFPLITFFKKIRKVKRVKRGL